MPSHKKEMATGYDGPVRPKSRVPLLIYLILMIACLIKISVYVSPWLTPNSPPPLLHHIAGEGFAVHTSGSTDIHVSPIEPATTNTETPLQSGVSPSFTTALSVTTSTPVLGIEPAPIEAALWPYQTFKSEDFTPPELKVSRSNETAPGLLFIGPRGTGARSEAPMIMTDGGELVWMGPNVTSNNMMLQTLNGSQHITFWEGASAFSFGHGYGSVHVLDSSYQEVITICPELDILTETDREYDCYLDMHESYITNRGTLIATAYNVTRQDLSAIGGPLEGWVYDSLFYEIDIDTSEILFRWSALNHLDQIPLNLTKEPLIQNGEPFGLSRTNPFDFFHINSVETLEVGFLVNSRHTWSVYKLDAQGDIEWRFSGDDGGDFQKADDISFSWQHHVRAVNVTSETIRLNMFNNANSENSGDQGHPSTGLQIFLDVVNRQALLLRELDDPDDHRISQAMGSWQSLSDERVLIGYGKEAAFKEFDRYNRCVYTAEFGNATGDAEVASYRVFKFDWSAEPAAPPKLAIEYSETSEETILYASWNGATPDVYDNWAVYAGPLKDDFPSITSVHQRTGFETEMRIPGRSEFCQVVARRGSLAVRPSEMVEVG